MKTLEIVRQKATEILEGLPGNLCYHNFQHTHEVVEAVQLIGRRSGLSKSEIEIVEIAAWLHGLGFIHAYKGYEEYSVTIAIELLEHLGMDQRKIDSVVGCIRATKWSVQPSNHMEAVIRDANFYYLASPEFVEKSLLLRKEWERKLGRVYSNKTWWTLNIRFFRAQCYFTHYGQQVLERRKRRNLRSVTLRNPTPDHIQSRYIGPERISATKRA